MAFDWEHVEAIRAEQDSARNRRDLNMLPTNEVSNEIYNSPSGREAKIPGLDHWEQMIQKVRTQLIDYIIEHGLVQGFEYDGINEPIKNGKIVITAEMLQRVTDRFGYFKEKETLEFVEKYLPEHHYVADADYVHTDNNYTDAEKAKLEGIADGAEVNKVISILFNGVESIDPEARVATITITPADVKAWYEQNPDTNVFTDAEKAKLESIDLSELSNKVEDVTLDGETVVKNKVAVLTAKKIKDSYESNADTNAFTDADKSLVEQVLPEVQKGVNQHEQRIDALEKSQTAQDAEIKDAKDSISELGDEVNSVAGRVTTLEASQKVQDGKIDTLEKWSDATNTVIGTLEEKNTAQDGEISELKKKNTEQDGRLDALEASQETQGADISQLKEDVKNAGKVDDVKVNGTSVVKNKVAEIALPDTSNLVPYSGATKNIDIGGRQLYAAGSHDGVSVASSFKPDEVLTEFYNSTTSLSVGISGRGLRLTNKETSEYVDISLDLESLSGGLAAGLFNKTGQNVRFSVGEPRDPNNATTKQYVDEKIEAIPTVDTSNLVPYSGAAKDVDLGEHGLLSGKKESGKEYSSGITSTQVSSAFKSDGKVAFSSLSGGEVSFGEIAGDGSFSFSMDNSPESAGIAAKLFKNTNTRELGLLKVAYPEENDNAATKKYVDISIPRFKTLTAGMDLSGDKPIIDPNSSKSVPTKAVIIPAESQIIGISETNVGAGSGKTLMGSVSFISKNTVSDGIEVSFYVAVCNPYTDATKVNTMAVTFTYV